MKFIAVILAAAALPIFGQTGSVFPQVPGALVRYLSLTPEQSSNIRSLNMSLSDYFDSKLTRMDDLNDQVMLELAKASPDPSLVGNSIVEIARIDRDLELEVRATVVKVQAVLNGEQKQKVKVLEEAIALRGTIQQAIGWALIAEPATTGTVLSQSSADNSSELGTEKTRLHSLLSRRKAYLGKTADVRLETN